MKKILMFLPALMLAILGSFVPQRKLDDKNVNKNAVIEYTQEVDVETLEELKTALGGTDNTIITLKNDIVITETLTTGSAAYAIICEADLSLTRAEGMIENLFVVSEDSTLTIGREDKVAKITIDGNRDVATGVTASMIYNNGTFNLYGGSALTGASAACSGTALINLGRANIVGGEVYNNHAEVTKTYAAIYVAGGSQLVLNEALVHDNTSTESSGAAIFAGTDSKVWIYDGEYYNNNADFKGGVINAKASEVIIDGAKIYSNESAFAGAIYAYDGTKLTITDSVFYDNQAPTAGVIGGELEAEITISDSEFYNNTASYGAAIFISGAKLTATNLNAHNNTSNNYGAVIHVEDDGETPTPVTEVIVTGGTYTENIAKKPDGSTGNGGAMFIGGSNTTAKITNATFSKNQAKYGGAIRINRAKVDIEGCTITENSTFADGYGAGIYASYNSEVNLKNTNIYKNASVYDGGGISIASSSSVTMTGGKINANTAKYGAGIKINDHSSFVQNSGSISYNQSTASGCGVFVEANCTYTLNDGSLSFNKAVNHGGAINSKGTVIINGGTIEGNTGTARGGAIYSYSSENASVTITDGTFRNNGWALTLDGETATLSDTEASTIVGGAINIQTGTLTITDGTFTNNTVTLSASSKEGNGGAVYIKTATATISGGTFENHSTPGGGAVIYVESGTLNITNGTYTSNTSASDGGVIYAIDSTVTIGGGTFSKNTTTTAGGAIFASAGTLAISGGEYKENSAKQGGALATILGTVTTITGGTFADNTHTYRGQDIYAYSSSSTAAPSKLVLKGGNFESICVQYGVLQVGGDVTVSEKITFWGSIATAYGYMNILDEVKNPLSILTYNASAEKTSTTNKFVRLTGEEKKDLHKLVYNINIDGDKTGGTTKQYLKVVDGQILRTVCTYRITMPNGIYTTAPTGGNEGDAVTFTTLEGYTISNVKYNGTAIEGVDGVYSFTMPASDVELTYTVIPLEMPITVNSVATGLIDVKTAETIGTEVSVNIVPSTEWRVLDVYYIEDDKEVSLLQEDGTYKFNMFIGVELYVKKVPLYQISFVADNNVEHTAKILLDGQEVLYAAEDDYLTVDIEMIDNRYLLDMENSYYRIGGNEVRYTFEDMAITMPMGNVTFYLAFIDMYTELTNIVEVETFAQLKTALETNTSADIVIKQDIEITETINVAPTSFNIIASGRRTLKRANEFKGTLFMVYDDAKLTLGLNGVDACDNSELTIDGNNQNVLDATGSLLAVINGADLTINASAKLTNNTIGINELTATYTRLGSAAGPAIVNFGGRVFLNGGTISNNSATSYGGAIYNQGYFELNSGKIVNNSASSHGGAIYNIRTFIMNGGEVSYNSVTGNESNAGAIYSANNAFASFTMNDGRIEGNSAVVSAGALYSGRKAVLTINYGEFVNNRTTSGNGGAMYIYGKAIIRDGLFQGNLAQATNSNGRGGAIYLNTSSGVENIFGELYLYGGVFEGNKAQNGGAISVHKTSTLYILEDSTVVFRNNEASNRGGAIYIASEGNNVAGKTILLAGTFEGSVSPKNTDITIQYGQLEIGGNAPTVKIDHVANTTEVRSFVTVISELNNPIYIRPIVYQEYKDAATNFLRAYENVDKNNVLAMVNLIPNANADYCFDYEDGAYNLIKRTYAINIQEGLIPAIEVALRANANQIVTIKAKAGYNVIDLKVDGQDIVNNKFTMPDRAVEISYTAALINYEVEVSSHISHGDVTIDKTTATIFDEIKVTIIPDKGYYLVALKVNGHSVDIADGEATIKVYSDTTITAEFKKASYVVSYNYGYKNKYEIFTVEAGEKIENEKPTRDGYKFEGWFIDKEFTTAYDFSEGVYAPTQLYAKWTKR